MASFRVIFWAACIAQAFSIVTSSESDVSDGSSNEDSGPEEQLKSTTLDIDERAELILAVANSIRKLSSFVVQEAADANDDLFFTLSMARGQLYQLRRDAPFIYADDAVGVLLTAAEADLASAALVLQENFKSSADLGAEFNFIMDPARGRTMVRLDPTHTIVDFGRKWLAGFTENLAKAGFVMQFNPQSSDRCLGQLNPQNLTFLESTLTGRSCYCDVDDPCWLMMTKPGAMGYYLTHQVMFLALGGTTCCSPDFETHARRYFASLLPWNVGLITPEILRYQCRIVLLEASLYAAFGVPDDNKDLFLEQGFLCGASVYMPEFFKPSWIRSVLSWQKPSGCFGFYDVIDFAPASTTDGRSLKAVDERPVPENTEERFVLEDSKDSEEDDLIDLDDVEHAGPSPRREKPMVWGCYSHNTGVALGYLSVAMRYLTD